jgi:hypothetical protein
MSPTCDDVDFRDSYREAIGMIIFIGFIEISNQLHPFLIQNGITKKIPRFRRI